MAQVNNAQANNAQGDIVNILMDISGSMDRQIRWFAGETRFQRAVFIAQVLEANFPGATFNYSLINSREQGKGLKAANLEEVIQRFNNRAKVAFTSDIASRINNILQNTISCSQDHRRKTLLFVFSDGEDTVSPAGIKFAYEKQMKELRGKLCTTVVHFGKVIPIPGALYFDGKQKCASQDELRRSLEHFIREMLLAVEPVVHEQPLLVQQVVHNPIAERGTSRI